MKKALGRLSLLIPEHEECIGYIIMVEEVDLSSPQKFVSGSLQQTPYKPHNYM